MYLTDNENTALLTRIGNLLSQHINLVGFVYWQPARILLHNLLVVVKLMQSYTLLNEQHLV